MLDFILALPLIFGCFFFMVMAIIAGLATYLGSNHLISKSRTEKIKDAASSLFKLVGLLVSLFLSLTFADVIGNVNMINTAVKTEAGAIADIEDGLQHFSSNEARDIRLHLIAYTQAVIDDDWPALAHDQLAERPRQLLKQMEFALLSLETDTIAQERILPRMLADKDLISDFRLNRLQHAMTQPPFFLVAVLLGYLLAMACFGLHRPDRPLVVLLSLFMAFFGLVIYLILAYSDPFQGVPGVDPLPLESVIETMKLEIS
jgi:cytochrome bd-type quinol oxidase subunit 2